MITGKYKILVYSILVFAVSFICRFNILDNSFALDDFTVVINNSFIHSFNNLAEIFNPKNLFYVLPVKCGARPFTIASFIVDFSIYNTVPFGYHLFSLTLHSINSALIFLFAFFLNNKKNIILALTAALFFSLHPLQSEVVSVISFRADILMVFFYLVTLNLLNFVLNKNNSKLIYVFIFISIIFAFFSKENSIVIPAVLLAYSFFLYNNGKLIKFSFAVMLVILFLFLFFWIERFPTPLYYCIYPNLYNNTTPLINISAYFSTLAASLFYNFLHIIYPVNLSVDYTVVPSIYITFLTVFSGIILLILFIKKVKDKYIKFITAAVIITYLPVSNLVPLVNTIADRYMYMPMAAVSVLFALLMHKFAKYSNKKIIGFFVISLMLLFVAISYQRGETYNNQYTLYSDAVLKTPNNIRVLYNMGVTYLLNKEYKKAVINFDKVSAINPAYKRDRIWFLTAMSYDGLKDKDTAIKYYYKAFLLNPLDREIVEKFISSFSSFKEAQNYVATNTLRLSDSLYTALHKYSDIDESSL